MVAQLTKHRTAADSAAPRTTITYQLSDGGGGQHAQKQQQERHQKWQHDGAGVQRKAKIEWQT